MLPRLRRLALLPLFSLLVFTPVAALRATTVIAPTFNELVAESEVIARVEVTAVRPAWVESPQGRIIKTFVTFRVVRALKGTPTADLTLPFLGGELDGETMRVSGMPRFTVGQKDIVFLSDTRGVQFSPLVGLMHGRYRVQTDAATSRDYIARDDGAPLESEADVQLPQAANSPANRLKSVARALSPADFESRISAEVARSVTAR